MYPGVEVGHVCVETELVTSGTTHTCGHDTCLLPGAVSGFADQWAARVTLASVNATGSTSGTDNLVVDSVHVVVTQGVADHWQGDVTECVHNVLIFMHISPSTGHTGLTVKGLARGRQTDFPGLGAGQVYGSRQFDHGDVVTVVIVVVVLSVHEDSLDLVDLRVVIAPDTGTTGQDTDSSTGGGVSHAVSGGHNPVVSDQGSPTDVVTVLSQGNLPGVSLNCCGFSSDNFQSWVN